MSVCFFRADPSVPLRRISLYGFINMASIYFPWALVAIDFVINGSGAGKLNGSIAQLA